MKKKIEFLTVPATFGTKRVVRTMQAKVRRLASLLSTDASIVDTQQFGWFRGILSRKMTLDEVIEVFVNNDVVHTIARDVRYCLAQEPWDEIRLPGMSGLGVRFQNGETTLQIPTSTDYYPER